MISISSDHFCVYYWLIFRKTSMIELGGFFLEFNAFAESFGDLKMTAIMLIFNCVKNPVSLFTDQSTLINRRGSAMLLHIIYLLFDYLKRNFGIFILRIRFHYCLLFMLFIRINKFEVDFLNILVIFISFKIYRILNDICIS